MRSSKGHHPNFGGSRRTIRTRDKRSHNPEQKPLTCFFWYTQGRCTKSDDECVFFHHWTGQVAPGPRGSVPRMSLEPIHRRPTTAASEHDLGTKSEEHNDRGHNLVVESNELARHKQELKDSHKALAIREQQMMDWEANLKAAEKRMLDWEMELHVRKDHLLVREAVFNTHGQTGSMTVCDTQFLGEVQKTFQDAREASFRASHVMTHRRNSLVAFEAQVEQTYGVDISSSKDVGGAISATAAFTLDLDRIEAKLMDEVIRRYPNTYHLIWKQTRH